MVFSFPQSSKLILSASEVNFSSDLIIHIFVVFVNILYSASYDSFVNYAQRRHAYHPGKLHAGQLCKISY